MEPAIGNIDFGRIYELVEFVARAGATEKAKIRIINLDPSPNCGNTKDGRREFGYL